jgi:chemotaxis-related protein WspB
MLHLLVQLGPDRYAISARDIVEVLPLVALKTLPGAARGVAGLLDYHGAALPVVDLSALALGRPAAPRVNTRLLIVRHAPPRGNEHLLGLLAEHTTEMIRRDPRDFSPAVGGGARFLGPIIHDPRGLIQRIEISALLTDELRASLFPEPVALPR